MPRSFAILFAVVLTFILVVFVVILVTIARGARTSLAQRRANKAAPLVTNPAVVTSRRTEVTGGGESHAITLYFVTFQFPTGDRQEFRVSGEEYAQIAERDRGLLSSQGTWFKGFQRDRSIQDRPS